MQDILKALGQRIRELRKKKGFSQEGFADSAGVHRTWMGALERGERNLSFHNLVLISRALGMTLSQLVSGVEKRAQSLSRKHANTGPSNATEQRKGRPQT